MSEIIRVKIDQLIADPVNARKHSPRNIEAIKGSLARFGQQKPIVIDRKNVIVAGNGTLAAALELGWTELDCVVTDLTGYDRAAFALADNRTAELAEWDKEILEQTLIDLRNNDYDIGMLDFDLGLNPKGWDEEKEDDVPEVEEKDVWVKTGDLFQLGNHRLLCGDSTKKEDVERLMGGEKAALWLSDPPYGINHVETSQEKGQSKGYKKIKNDDLKDDEFKDFIFKVITTSLPHMKKNFAFYMWHAMKMQGYTAAAAAAAAGILFHRQIIWVKPQFVFGRGHYHWRHELCLMGWLQGDEPEFYGERNQTSVWECARENDKIHPTQKPIEILTPSINNHSKNGEIIYEPFIGSGSTLIACEKTNRRCFGMEIDPHYCQIIIERFKSVTGKEAVKIG